jgi:hypothetical protein
VQQSAQTCISFARTGQRLVLENSLVREQSSETMQEYIHVGEAVQARPLFRLPVNLALGVAQAALL